MRKYYWVAIITEIAQKNRWKVSVAGRMELKRIRKLLGSYSWIEALVVV